MGESDGVREDVGISLSHKLYCYDNTTSDSALRVVCRPPGPYKCDESHGQFGHDKRVV